jgi:hypothetical protein
LKKRSDVVKNEGMVELRGSSTATLIG